MLILQNCTNSPQILGGLCSDKNATLPGDVHWSVGIADMDIMVEEMSVVKFEEDAYMDIKGEELSVVKFEDVILINTIEGEFPEDVTSHTKKAEQDQVSYICVSPLLELTLGIFHNVQDLLSQYLHVCLSL
jgi:hypothetical protein